MRCVGCGSRRTADSEVAYKNEGRHAHPIFEDLRLIECRRCQTSWVSDPPLGLGEYYASHYEAAGMDDRWPIWDSRPASLLMIARLLTQLEPGDRILDVGPGNGAALSLAPHLFPGAELGCVEFSVRSIELFKQHIADITISESVSDVVQRWGKRSIKLVYSAHCLEHIPAGEIRVELEEIRRGLRRDGLLALEVPFAPPKRVAASNHTPHLVFFTEVGLKAALRRQGFEVALCYVAPGRTKKSNAFMKRTYPIPAGGGAFAAKVAALNTADFVSRNPEALAAKGAGGVIKCFARPR